MRYSYEIEGSATPPDQAWKTTGIVEVDPGNFVKVPQLALLETLQHLQNQSKDCRGPFQILRLEVKLLPTDEDGGPIEEPHD